MSVFVSGIKHGPETFSQLWSCLKMEEVLLKILTKVHDNVDLFLKVITTFSFHHIYRLRFSCGCGSARYCAVYLLVPGLVIWILLLAVDRHFFKSLVRWVQERESRPVSVCKGLTRLVLTLCVSLIWPVSVLLDGDWFVCCREDFYGNRTTQLDETVLKTTSWIYGMYVLLGLSLFLFISSSVRAFIKDLRLFEMLIEEEDSVETKVREAMRRKTERDLDLYVFRGEWRKCYDEGQKVHQWRTAGEPTEHKEPQRSESSDDSGSGTDRDVWVKDWSPPPLLLDGLQMRTVTKSPKGPKAGAQIRLSL